MTDHVNRFMTPLPDSVLDRFFAAHPEEIDDRVRPTRPTAEAVRQGVSENDRLLGEDDVAP